MGGRITAVAVVIAVGVVMRIHRRHVTMSGRRHRRAETVVVVAVVTGAVVIAHSRPDMNHHPRLGARSMPTETDRLEVFEGGETVEFATHRVIRHERVGNVTVDGVAWNLNGDSLDATRTHFHIFFGIAGAVVWVKENADVAPISVIANVFHVVVDRD